MRTIILVITFLSVCSNMLADDTDTTIMHITYLAKFKKTVESPSDTDVHRLDIGNVSSRYYSTTYERRRDVQDSLLKMGGSAEEVQDELVKLGLKRKHTKYNVYKNFPAAGTLTYHENIMGYLIYEEDMPVWNWNTEQGDTVVAGYHCEKATASFRGRTWTVWYTLDIPVSDGPWKLSGLPGLILYAEDAKGDFTFDCIGIENGKGIPIVLRDAKFQKATPQKIEQLIRLELKDPTALIQQTLGVKSTIYDKNGRPMKFTPKEPCLLEYFESKK